MPSDACDGETYRDPCPKCGVRLLGVSKAEFLQHLRDNDEDLTARIWGEMVIEKTPNHATETTDRDE